MTEREWQFIIVGIVGMVVVGIVLYLLSQTITFLQQNPIIAALGGGGAGDPLCCRRH